MEDDRPGQYAACDDTESYFVHSTRTVRIAIIGPESSGKSTLAAAIAQAAGGALVLEAARSYLPALNRPYEQHDLITIARIQHDAEREAASAGQSLVVCDTDILTISIWSDERFGGVDDKLLELMRGTRYDRTFLCKPDMPWEPDPLRENPHDRDRLFDVYRDWLQREQRPYEVVIGPPEERLRRVLESIGGGLDESE